MFFRGGGGGRSYFGGAGAGDGWLGLFFLMSFLLVFGVGDGVVVVVGVGCLSVVVIPVVSATDLLPNLGLNALFCCGN